MPHERVLYPEIIAGLKADGHRAWRVPDGGGPVDIAGFTSGGRCLLIEVKKLDRWKQEWPEQPWEPWGFEPHQVGWLSECAGAGGVGCAVLWVPGSKGAVRAVCLSRGAGRCGWPYVRDRVRKLDRRGGEVRGWSVLPGWPFR